MSESAAPPARQPAGGPTSPEAAFIPRSGGGEAAPCSAKPATQGEAEAAENGPPPPKGLECAGCGCRHFRVIYTRAATGGVRRRRECRHCGRRLTTYEGAEE